jgi:hypothetical protein
MDAGSHHHHYRSSGSGFVFQKKQVMILIQFIAPAVPVKGETHK